MLTQFYRVIFFSLILCGCASTVAKPNSFRHIESQPVIANANTTDTRIAKVGEYLYRQAEQHEIESITLLSEIKIKPKNVLKPSVNIPPQNLIKTSSKYGYDYYVAKSNDSIQKQILKSLNRFQAQNKGIKIKQDGSDMQVFLISDREFSYPFPENAHWKKTLVVDLNKSAHENSLKYNGMQGNNLTFTYFKLDNVVKDKFFSSSTISDQYTQHIAIPVTQKVFSVEDKTIHILAANANDIQFRLTENNS